MDAGTLAHAVDRLANTGRVLYVAAHPDDENTRLLAYLANARHVTAAYLSVTRGGGGQNLIGPEQAELLGVIRTEELLAARGIDAARQFFTRMRDFGYSKSAEETLATWGHQEALADVVWVIRTFRPDVVITRFDETSLTHGHHTASAILAREAFEAAGDRTRFPEHLAAGAEAWHPNRLLLNVPLWRDRKPPPDALALDVGVYDPRLGVGYGELAATSRSQHKSQGFGRAGERGPIMEYFLPVAGTKPKGDILEGLRIDWARFGQLAAPVDEALEEAIDNLRRDTPESALPALLRAHAALSRIPPVPRVLDARTRLDEIIAAVTGLFVRATAARPAAVPGSDVRINLEISLRRPAAMKLEYVTFPGAEPLEVGTKLDLDGRREIGRDVTIPADASISTPYWLAEPPQAGRYVVTDPHLVGRPTGPPPLVVKVGLSVGDETVQLQTPVLYAWTDRVHGERTRRFLIVPPATITPVRRAVMFPNHGAATVTFRVRSGTDSLSGDVALALPDGWGATPKTIRVDLPKAGDERMVSFEITPAANAAAAVIRPTVIVGGKRWSYREDVIDYPHIPVQVVLRPAAVKVVPIELKVPSGVVGYIEGSGDTVAEDLAHVGIGVSMIDDQTLRSGDLSRFAAIVVGIRAYNTREALRAAHDRLMKYVKDGGVVVVQYNTSSEWAPLEGPVGPYPLEIGRGRVTDETAEMQPVDAEQPLLQAPNRIGVSDFEGWVQERGLYFGETWDERYAPIFRVHDPGGEPLRGSVLVAEHGRGRYVYTGLAFFRQLPAGVPGAYRLMANLIAKGRP